MAVQKLSVYSIYSLGLAGLLAIGISFFNQLACEGQLVNVNLSPSEQQQIWGDQIVGQSFIAPRNHLNRVDLFFQTYGRKNSRDVTLRLLEISAGAENILQGPEIFSITFNAAMVRDQSWRTFTFPEVANSAGKSYLIILQSPRAVPGDAITVGGIDKDIYGPGSAFLGSVQIPADINFRACFQMTALEKLRVLSNQITRYRPSWWGDSIFYIICLVIYSLLLVILFWRLAKFVL
jgi:hypothetical protein